MITKKFDITQKPLLDDDKAAYLVDSRNVETHRQYVEKYYSNRDLRWFYNHIREPICTNKIQKLLLYYDDGFIGIDCNISSSRATRNQYTIYNITNALMIVE